MRKKPSCNATGYWRTSKRPKDSNNDKDVNSESDSDFKNILNSKKNQKANSTNTSSSLKESIIKKIEIMKSRLIYENFKKK